MSSQVSPSLDFDFDKFLAEETVETANYGNPSHISQFPEHNGVPLDYDILQYNGFPQGIDDQGWYEDLSQAGPAPRIEHQQEQEDANFDDVASNWWEAQVQGDYLATQPTNHGSSSVPINISAPVDEGLWNPLSEDIKAHVYPSSAPITRPSSVEAVGRDHLVPNPGNGVFLNPILNNFTSPSTPLGIIDAHMFPFEAELQAALQLELDNQIELEKTREIVAALETELSRRKQSEEDLLEKLQNAKSLLPVPPTPAPTPAPSGEGIKTPKNNRTHNIASTDPTKHYDPLTETPKSWGTVAFDTGRHIFRYTKYGELDPKQTFEVNQIAEFLSQHPLPNKTLTLWIQTVPADSAGRYATKTSDKCRFSNCPDPNRTIRKGDFRVAFDEDFSNRKRDPFHVAGYCHLFCLEKNFDFPQICKDYDVRPDTRELPEGKNKMAITRDHKSMAGIVTKFIRESVPWADVKGGRPEQYYGESLCFKLTMEHLEKQPRHLQGIREVRGGNTIDRHKNNLDVYVENQRRVRLEQSAGKRPAEKRPAGKKTAGERPAKRSKGKEKAKRNRDEEEGEESILDDEILQRGLKSPHKVKRLSMWLVDSSASSKRKLEAESESDDDSDGDGLSRRPFKRLRSGRRLFPV
ncbi:hypothetical protein MBM_00226 [Drepanopeziza brunnea f. sp. 'multigermtubi' MB_m1]|uniref:Uncharacterized protein n=2 Tax=Drepanopeziza brunnea f. sp. 'multigermtubi' TaxID=698441 RepID=K1XKJ0_MARBU|nr:uncharacterized protein MBM_00226 [Drepanopeziza brunnea f. sp. 'multigermtubi' MB_m1]EKD21113.1 hypothetical protein MBM_00226 [Drepanopeziza brunnea f. sp. 'multigermtubi' MB_m1]